MTATRPNAHAEKKRAQLAEYIEEQLAPHACVRGVVAIGSVANGKERAS